MRSTSACLVVLLLVVVFCPAAAARTWFVDHDGSGDATTIAAGLDSAFAGDTVFVAAASYYEHDLRLRVGATLIGESGPSGGVRVDALGLGRGLRCMGPGTGDPPPPSAICGIAFRNGISRAGAGVYCRSAVLGIADCRFEENETVHSQRQVGGALYAEDAEVQATGCSFLGNNSVAAGGAVAAIGSSVVLDGCAFVENVGVRGGGVYIEDSPWLEAVQCQWLLNRATGNGGAMDVEYTDAQVREYLFVANAADVGGGVYSRFKMITVSGSTFIANAALRGAGIARGSADGTFRNLIIASSTAGEAFLAGGIDRPDVACCDFHANAGGDWTGRIGQLGPGCGPTRTRPSTWGRLRAMFGSSSRSRSSVADSATQDAGDLHPMSPRP